MQYPPNQEQPSYPVSPQQPPPFQPATPPKKKRRIPRWLWIVVGIFVVAAACSGLVQGIQSANTPTSSPTQAAQSQATSVPQSTQPLIEHLTFHGDISGTLTSGINPQPLTHNNPIPNFVQQPDGTYFDPPPTATQCSDFDSGAGQDFVAVIVGLVGAKRYAITVEINEDNAAWTHPGTPLHPGITNSGGSLEVYEIGGQNRRCGQVYGSASQEPVIVLHPDKASGTVDAWMASTVYSQKDASGTLHLQGDWRCG